MMLKSYQEKIKLLDDLRLHVQSRTIPNANPEKRDSTSYGKVLFALKQQFVTKTRPSGTIQGNLRDQFNPKAAIYFAEQCNLLDKVLKYTRLAVQMFIEAVLFDGEIEVDLNELVIGACGAQNFYRGILYWIANRRCQKSDLDAVNKCRRYLQSIDFPKVPVKFDFLRPSNDLSVNT